MSDFFSKITGAIAGPILLGSFFPVLLFVTAVILVLLPVTPYGHELTATVKDPLLWQKNPATALVVTIIVLVLSIVLYNLNTSVIRLYEGYPWQHSWIGQRLTERHKKRWDRAYDIREQISTLRTEARTAGSSQQLATARMAQRELGQLLNSYYPDKRDSILPTTLGNAVRAFETYPRRQYQAAIIPLWPRLLGVIEPAFANSLDSAKTSFDFMIHLSFLSGILAYADVCYGLYWRSPWQYGFQAWIFWSALFCASRTSSIWRPLTAPWNGENR